MLCELAQVPGSHPRHSVAACGHTCDIPTKDAYSQPRCMGMVPEVVLQHQTNINLRNKAALIQLVLRLCLHALYYYTC